MLTHYPSQNKKIKIWCFQVRFLWLKVLKFFATTCNSTIIEICDDTIRISHRFGWCQIIRFIAVTRNLALRTGIDDITGFRAANKRVLILLRGDCNFLTNLVKTIECRNKANHCLNVFLILLLKSQGFYHARQVFNWRFFQTTGYSTYNFIVFIRKNTHC